MYIPYRKAYISGMNPLSFVTVFTIGELGTMIALVLALDGGTKAAVFHSGETRHLLFWLFLGGFVWVIGDLFQQFATKYLGIGRGIPLSNTNQMWGLAWGALVFGELAHADAAHRLARRCRLAHHDLRRPRRLHRRRHRKGTYLHARSRSPRVRPL